MKMSLSSASVWMSPNNCSRLSSIRSPGSLTRARASDSPAGQHRGFAAELPSPVGNDQCFGSRGRPQHLHLAAQHDEERHRPLSHLYEHIAGRDGPPSSVRRDARDLVPA